MTYTEYCNWFETPPEHEHLAYKVIENADTDEISDALIRWLDTRGKLMLDKGFRLGEQFGHACKQGIDSRLCTWLARDYTEERCLVTSNFLRSFWFHTEDIDPVNVEVFISFLNVIPLGSECDRKVSNMLADLADPATVKDMPEDIRTGWKDILLARLNRMEMMGLNTAAYDPLVKLKQGEARRFFQIYNDIDNKWREQQRFTQLQELCQNRLVEIQASLKMWFTEYEKTRRSYEDLQRLGHFFAAACANLEMDRIVYEWQQESPSPTRSQMMGWFLSRYWANASEPYLPCIAVLKEFVALAVEQAWVQDGAREALSIMNQRRHRNQVC